MTTPTSCESVLKLCDCINELMQPFAGRVEYGNLRMRVCEWDTGTGDPTTNIALVYETPGGSTDQINVDYLHACGHFCIIHEHEGECRTQEIDFVLNCIQARISDIPRKRLETLCGEIQRQLESGSNTTGLVGHLNRMMNSDFKGGAITHHEMRDAMTFAVKCMKGKI
jgi:hypothetical protein